MSSFVNLLHNQAIWMCFFFLLAHACNVDINVGCPPLFVGSMLPINWALTHKQQQRESLSAVNQYHTPLLPITECVIKRLSGALQTSWLFFLLNLLYSASIFHTLEIAHARPSLVFYIAIPPPFFRTHSAVSSTPWPVCQPPFPWQLVRNLGQLSFWSWTHAGQTEKLKRATTCHQLSKKKKKTFNGCKRFVWWVNGRIVKVLQRRHCGVHVAVTLLNVL